MIGILGHGRHTCSHARAVLTLGLLQSRPRVPSWLDVPCVWRVWRRRIWGMLRQQTAEVPWRLCGPKCTHTHVGCSPWGCSRIETFSWIPQIDACVHAGEVPEVRVFSCSNAMYLTSTADHDFVKCAFGVVHKAKLSCDKADTCVWKLAKFYRF